MKLYNSLYLLVITSLGDVVANAFGPDYLPSDSKFFEIYHACNTNQKDHMFHKKRYGNPILLQMMSGKGTQFLNPIYMILQ